jgi:UDP-N-acetylglucosamine 3-dehydrogenase
LAVLKAGVIGVGDMGRNHVRVYNELDQVEVVGICDTNAERATRVSRIYKVPHFSSAEDFFTSLDLDVVTVAVPTALHFQITSLALEHGVGVLVEKPIDLELDRARGLVKQASKKGIPLMVGHIERFNPAVIRLKELMFELGTPTLATATRAGPLPTKVRDVGAIVDLGVHDLDVLRYILGSEVQRLFCECGSVIHSDRTDYAKILMWFANGLVASMDVNWLTPVKIRRLTIQGPKAMIEVDYIRQELYDYEISYSREYTNWSDVLIGMMEGEMRKIPVKKEEPLKNELRAFVDSVSEGKTPPVTGEDGIRAVELALLAEESGKRHEVLSP